MKQIKMYCTIFCAALSLMLSSCGSNDESTTSETTVTDSTESMQAPETPMTANYEVNPPYNLMVVTHKVANYDKWKASYDKHDSVRLAFGMHSYVVARMLPDSNTVLVAVKADDLDKGMAFGKDPSLKMAMKDGGVIGTPEMHTYKVVYDATNTLPTDTRVVRNVSVKDWDAWKKAFEGSRQLRLDNGMEDRSYGYEAADNHKVMVVLALTDTAKANAFMKSDTMKKMMDEAGVEGAASSKMIRIVARY
ncbi:MAG: hypothetical protein ABI594_17875 [Ginsengibacter sp.]